MCTKCWMSVFQEPDGMSCVLQDFEIAGSRTGALSTDCAGGCECETPIGTINSWDSHSHYRHRAASPDLSLYSGVIVYCDHTHLRTPTGLVRVLLVVSFNLDIPTLRLLDILCWWVILNLKHWDLGTYWK